MKNKKILSRAFSIQTEEWMPDAIERWPAKKIVKFGNADENTDDFYKKIKSYTKKKKWVFPKQPIHFISDLHADADALIKSMVGAGFIKKTGIEDHDFEVLEKAFEGKIIIGGDCLDKGPSNLRLLDVIKLLKDAGIPIHLLAGNHDIRTFAGLAIGEDKKLVEQHMFIRMGQKAIPLFWEIYKKYLHKKQDLDNLLSEEEVEMRLFPSEDWFEIYAERMEGLIPPKKIAKEATRIREKINEVRAFLSRTGFTHGMLYATVQKAQEIFLSPNGEYAWFFNEMKVAMKEGSFLFVHAGLDDFSTDWIGQVGVDGLNEKFKILMRNDPFELYHGHIGNIFRTKYRDTEFPFSSGSAKKLPKLGINAIVHGHRNVVLGHRVVLKKGVLNFECDTTLDRKTREKEGLEGVGAGWFTISPRGEVEAYSTDYPSIKKFNVRDMGAKVLKQFPKKKSQQSVAPVEFKDTSLLIEATTFNRKQACNLLKNLAMDMNTGLLKVERDQASLLAQLPEELQVKVEGETKGEKGSLTITLDWG